jgi:uncharacterized RDD family membrane protein YckC/ribosomal protein L40E
MPVKIRCRGCEKVLSAPDIARGKVIACPQCGTKLKVPGGSGEVVPKGTKAKAKKEKQPSMQDSAEFMAGLDLSNMESQDERVCPFCAAEMPAEATICRECGMNVETGAMDAKEAKRRARRGPDPALFYSKAWSDSFAWTKEHWKMAVTTGWYMSVLAVLHTGCAFMMTWSTRWPPKFFWFVMSMLALLGIAGWFWFLTYKVIEATMTRDEKILERISFDMFAVISLGLRALFWPAVCLWPLLPLAPLLVLILGPLVGSIAFDAVFFPLALLFYPLATVHLTQKYTYKAWVGWEMLKIALRNFAPAAYYCLLFVLVLLPVALVAAPMFWVMGLNGQGNPFLGEHIDQVCNTITVWFLKLTGDQQPNPDTFVYIICMVPLKIMGAFLTLTPIFLVAALPAIFMMRVNGLLGYYNRETLGLVNFIPPNTPANFWIRVLAFALDSVLAPFASILVVKEPKAVLIGWIINLLLFVAVWYVPVMILPAACLWSLYMYWMYFAVQEATTTRTTIGKDAFGLIVSNINDKQMTLKQASLRVLGRLVCIMTAGAGYLLAALPNKRGLHDLIAGTKCAWRGDR